MDAYNHPAFYRQLGKQPDEITAQAVRVLIARYGSGSVNTPRAALNSVMPPCRACRGLS